MNRRPSIAAAGLAALIALAQPPAAAQGAAHVHGQAQLDVALDGAALVVRLQVPLDGLMGFEHRPRTTAQRQAADIALARLREVPGWLQPPAAAGCSAGPPIVEAPALASATPSSPALDRPGHADLVAEVRFHCEAPDRLDTLDVGLFRAFARIRRIDAQVAGPAGQRRQVLRPGAATLRLAR